MLGRLVTLLILLSATESLLLMQLSQVSIAAGFAAHPALVAIMYRVLPAAQYARAVGLVGSVLVAALIGTSNFVSNWIYDAIFFPTPAS